MWYFCLGQVPLLIRQTSNHLHKMILFFRFFCQSEIVELHAKSDVGRVRRGNDVPKSFEDAKKELEVSMRNRRAYGFAAELAQKVTDALKQNKDVQKTAAEFAAQANMNVGETNGKHHENCL